MTDSSMEIVIVGSEAIVRKLDKLGKAAGGGKMMTALRVGALHVVNAAKRSAPILTGTLRRSIHMENVSGALAVAVGTKEAYARRQEFGFSGRDSLGRRYNQPAHPYLRPALAKNKKKIREEIAAVLKMALR